MPELPEVETTRKSLLPRVKGRKITSVTLNRADLRFPFPSDFVARLKGRKIADIRRRAKYLLFDLDSGEVLLAHLGMSGSFLITSPETHKARKHDHVVFTLDSGDILVFHDPRRFGLMDIIPKRGEGTHKLLAHLGPEPLSKDFSVSYLKKALAKRKGPIKPTLMDQQLVVGVGNIYASESLFSARVHPATPANEVIDQVDVLIKSIRSALNAALKSGGSTLRDYTRGDGEAGYFQHEFKTYERRGQPCFACGTPIAEIVQAGRTSYFCPQCQKQKSHRRVNKKIASQKTKQK